MINQNNYLISTLLVIICFFLLATPVFAHIIVYPKQVGIAQTQVFDMTVPTERDNPTVAIKLLIPNGVMEVIPNVKQGWTINTVKKGDIITEIDWANGSIPPNERDDFYFQAQVPPTLTTLKWKAYQTYQDGSIVAWDHIPTNNPYDDTAPPPYSTTKVINDLTNLDMKTTQSSSRLPIVLSIVALALSALTLGIVIPRKSQKK